MLAVAAQCGFATYPAGATLMRRRPWHIACVILEGEADVFVKFPPDRSLATIGRHGTSASLVFSPICRAPRRSSRAPVQ